MKTKRIIPVLLLNERKLVKTTKFKSPRYVGDPINTVKILNEKKADEIFLVDINTKKWKTKITELKEIASEMFTPAGYAGGINYCEQATEILSIGFEKVIIPYHKIFNDNLLSKIASQTGSQSVIVSLDLKKIVGSYYNLHRTGIAIHKTKIKNILLKIGDAGAGEIIIHSVDRDGTFAGFDRPLFDEIPADFSIPIIALGGAGKREDLWEILDHPSVDAAAAGSIFCFYGKHRAVLVNYPDHREKI